MMSEAGEICVVAQQLAGMEVRNAPFRVTWCQTERFLCFPSSVAVPRMMGHSTLPGPQVWEATGLARVAWDDVVISFPQAGPC
jgi:hypothetical protein